MGLKRSIYNTEVKKFDNGDILLFNSFSSALGVMNKSTQDIYYNIENINQDLNQYSREIKVMKDNGFLVNDELDEFKVLDLKERLIKYDESRFLSLTIAPTLSCNMECPYCYEKKNSVRMDYETQKNIVQFIKTRIESFNLKGLSIHWYGGEPLLEKDTIVNISKEVISICSERSVNYESFIVTNGVLLDSDTALTLRNECNITTAQITLDGVGENNNLTRKLKNGLDSFSIITENIEKCKDIVKISIRMNVSKDNISETSKMAEYVSERDWAGKVFLYFAPVHSTTEENACIANTCFTNEEFAPINNELQKILIDKKLANEYPYPRNMGLGCGGMRINTYVIGPSGELYKCWHHIGIEDKRVGNVKDGASLNSVHIDWLTVDYPDKCKKCSILPICRGGCPDLRMNNNTPPCDYRKISYKKHLIGNYELFFNK